MRSSYLLALILAATLTGGCRESETHLDPSDGEVTKKSSEELMRLVELLVADWSDMKAEARLDHQAIRSWLPDRGIRGRYQIAKSLISQSAIESVVGESIFLEGPHDNGVNFNCGKEFGRYNPEFLRKLHGILEDTSGNETFVVSVQGLYDSQLKRYLRTYYLSYEVAADNKEVMDGYLAAIDLEVRENTEGVMLADGSNFLRKSFRGFAEAAEKSGYDGYEALSCPGFWVRRSIDGTADEFYGLLKLTLQTFDNEFLEEQALPRDNTE